MISTPVVGILSPGEMGAAVGRVLRDHGLRVVTCLEGRGEWTLSRAREAGFQDLPSYDELISEADIILSILPPAQALAVAGSAADAVRRTGAHVVYVDCNAIAPQTVRKVAHIVKQSGAEYIDAGIIGGPPSREHGPHIYASGPNAQSLEVLKSYGLDVRVMGDGIDQASSLKMVYAASTKGIGALWMELIVAAEAMGIRAALEQEIEDVEHLSRSRVERFMAGMAPKSGRYVGEMEEIAATFAGVGLTPRMLLGAADMFALVSGTPLADHPGGHRHEMERVIECLAQAAANART